MEKKDVNELTNPQKNIWLTEQYYKGTNINNVCGIANIVEKVNFEILKQAINTVIKNNSSFLINFRLENNKLIQYKTNYKSFDIEIIEVTSNEDVKNLEQNLLNKVFNIENSYLFEFKIYKFKDNTGGFILNIHHLLADSWSLGLTCKKIIETYNCLITGHEQEISSSDYFDFCASEKEYLNSEKFEKDKQYWENLFETVPEVASIPSNKKTTVITSCKASRKTFEFSSNIVKKINTFCRENKISIFNFITAIYSLYISRVCDLNNFVIGTPILNRTDFTQKNTTGMFVNTVPLRVNINHESSFIDLATSIGKDSMSMLRHQRYPYEFLLKKIREKEPNLPNLYNILISYQITKAITSELKYSTSWAFNGNSSDELQIHILDINDTGMLNVSYDYKLDKFDEQTIIDLHRRIEHIINQILSNNSIEINAIEIVTIEEKNEILNKFNDTNLEYDPGKTIIELFEEQVKKTPDNISIVFENKNLTYRELNEKSNQLAHYLIKQGIKNNDIIGVMTNRSFEMIVGILATLKAGGAYIPIDPEYPENRISYILENSKCSVLLSQNELENKLKNINFNGNIVFVDFDNNNIYTNNIENPSKTIKPEDLSYVIYTSGSTGNPKGVMLTHRNYSNFYNSMINKIDYLKDGKPHSIISITTFSFDIFAFETVISLTRGLKLFMTNNSQQKMTSKIENLLIDNEIEILQTTPSIMNFHLENSINNGFSKLKYIVLAGEQLPKQLIDRICSIIPNVTIYNGYGPSETTIFSAVKNVTNIDTVTIGTPINNTQFYILDNNLNIVPKGITGEIYIAGDGVSRGYLNNENLTKERYLNNPFKNNSIMYKTGDIGSWLENGEILCKGRIDNQIKLRGLRIELEEIENSINSFDLTANIKSAVIIKNINNKDVLCAFISTNKKIDDNLLQKHLLNCLPIYMVPNSYTYLNNLPLTPNGKIDRKILKSFEIAGANSSAEFENPKTKTEKIIFNYVSQILNNNNFGISNSFFDIGMDSLCIINLASKLSEKFNYEISISDIYNSNSIKQLAYMIEEQKNKKETKKINKTEKQELYNVSSAQKRIFFSTKISGDNSCLYNMPGAIIFDELPDINKLNECFNLLIKRHDSLRTCFEITNNKVYQKIVDDISFKLESISLNVDNINQLFKNFVLPFDLTKAPLFRAKLINTKDKAILLFDIHHIISDGLSLTIIAKELSNLYNGNRLNPLTYSYVDYSEWEFKQLSSDNFSEDKNYWINQFKGEIPVLNIPTDFQRPAVQSFEGSKICKILPKDLAKKIDELSKNLNVSNNMLLLACYYILLAKYTGQEDIIVGSPVVGRKNSELSNNIGMFANTLALRNHVDFNMHFSDFLDIIKNNSINAISHQNYPFDALVNDLNITRDASRNPIFDTMFIYQNSGYPKMNFIGLKSTLYIPNIHISKFDLSLEIVPIDNEFKLTFEYATSLFKEYTINQLSEHYINIIKSILNNPNQIISDIEILSEKEKNTILYGFNDTKAKFEINKNIKEMLEDQAAKTPNNIAVVFGNKKLTYKDLNEKSNSLAYFLRNNFNIGRNDIVGIMVNRSLETLIAFLAVIKSGGTYIPIDPAFPNDRIDYMLKSSNAKLLLTLKNLEEKIDYKNKLSIDLNQNNIYNLPNENLININTPEDLMYIIFTSGSTGKPKGVMITHKVFTNFTNYCNNYVEYLKNPQNEAIVSITTISFDIFAYETLISLQKGLKVVIADENEQTTPYLLNQMMEINDAKIIQSTPSVMQIFINNLDDIPALRKIKYFILSGEQLPLDLVKRINSISNCEIYNGYGPSETYYCTLAKMNNDLITIGKPISNCQMYILDKYLKPIPIGSVGDIYISGECVGNGYLNNEELTRKTFIPNPFMPNTIMYKSGDLGKYLEDGNIICLGRSDHQVKIRGLRIELEEIESLMLKYPNISKASVVKQSLQNREFISAYFVANKRISINELRKYLSTALPKYMVPSYYTALDDLPYTPNGKIDKKALPLPSKLLNTSKEKYQPPKTELEKTLVSIWEKLLNIKPIGINDNFFELGGDSLLAMNLNMELSKITKKVTYQDIFHFPTISEIEKLIESNDKIELFKNIENLPNDVLNVLTQTKQKNKCRKYLPKNILLTGSTGFLGMHILDELLKLENTNIYCIIRNEPGLTAEYKLNQKLNYYFGDKYKNLINTRIFAITGNICEHGFGLKQEDLLNLANKIDIVINSAANVAHFGNYNNFYKTNVLSVKYMIDFCKAFNIKLYHISTMGVAGISLNSSYLTLNKNNKILFDESSLYIGQEPETVYSYTKFLAEIEILKAINVGLDAYILRMGNLMPRYSDGIFQENVLDNAFINRVATFIRIGIVPKYLLDFPLEFTPVDYAARAICKIVSHQTDKNRIFHLFNSNYVSFKKCFKILKKRNINIEILNEKDFIIKIKELFKDDKSKYLLEYILDDFDENTHIDYRSNISIKSKFSERYLRRANFTWPRISNRYLNNFFEILKEVL